MKDKISKIAMFGRTPEWAMLAGKENPKAPLAIARHAREQAIAIFEKHRDDVTRINDDTELTESGKERRLQELAVKRCQEISTLRESLMQVEVAKIKAVEEAKKDVAPEDRVINTLLEIEVRKSLTDSTGCDPMQTRLQYLDALDVEDHLTMDAIENAPRLWRGRLQTDDLAELKERRLLQTDPRLGSEVRSIAQALADTTTTLDTVIGELQENVDTLAEVASG